MSARLLTLFVAIALRAAGAIPLSRKQSTEVRLRGGTVFAFSAPVTIGSQHFELLVDTGSTTTAVARRDCVTCNVAVKYNPGRTSTNVGGVIVAEYGTGTTFWIGERTSDRVSVANLEARIVFGAITSQNLFFAGDGPPDYDGILGLAYPPLLVPGTDSFLLALSNNGVLTANLFAIQVCNLTFGELSIGALNASMVPNVTQIVWTPVVEEDFYVVTLNSLQIGTGVRVQMPNADPIPFIVDSGTSLTLLPATMYESIVVQLNTNPVWVHAFGQEFWLLQDCVVLPPGVTEASLNRDLPHPKLSFDGFTLTLLPSKWFAFRNDAPGGTTCYSPGIAPTPTGERNTIGLTTILQFVTIFDVGNSRVGFYAPTMGCGAGANVSATSDSTQKITLPPPPFRIVFLIAVCFIVLAL